MTKRPQRKFLCKVCRELRWKGEMTNPQAKRPGICRECSEKQRQAKHSQVREPMQRGRTGASFKRERFSLWGVSEEHREMLRRCAKRRGVTMPVAAEIAFTMLYESCFNQAEQQALAQYDNIVLTQSGTDKLSPETVD